MINTQSTLGALTIGTVYTINYAFLDRIPYFIKVTGVVGSVATYNTYTDATGGTVITTGATGLITDTIFIIVLTS